MYWYLCLSICFGNHFILFSQRIVPRSFHHAKSKNDHQVEHSESNSGKGSHPHHTQYQKHPRLHFLSSRFRIWNAHTDDKMGQIREPYNTQFTHILFYFLKFLCLTNSEKNFINLLKYLPSSLRVSMFNLLKTCFRKAEFVGGWKTKSPKNILPQGDFNTIAERLGDRVQFSLTFLVQAL